MKVAICPGSFDPITNGHLDIIKRAENLFSSVIILVVDNPHKSSLFSLEERLSMVNKVTKKFRNVKVDSHEGLLVDYVKNIKGAVIVKGLRMDVDFEYESQMEGINHTLFPEVDTVFLNTRSQNQYISSSAIKEIAYFGGDIKWAVPAEIVDEIYKKFTVY